MKTIAKVLVVSAIAAAVVALGVFLAIGGHGNQTPSVVINGTKYWATNVTLTESLTTVQLRGVTFNFSYPCDLAAPPPPTGGLGQGCANVTFTTIPCNTNGAQFCQGNLPEVQIVFPDGTNAYFNNATTIKGVITYDSMKILNHIYFTAHSGPRVGIEWLYDSATHSDNLLLLVSA